MSTGARAGRPPRPDVVVVGGGLIGLACAAAIAAEGAAVALLTERTEGEASAAAAGMLAPGVERASGAAHAFALAARDRYPDFLAALAARTGLLVPLNARGVLEVALDQGEARRLAADRPEDAPWLDPAGVAAAEPGLGATHGGVLHRRDGAVDNVALVRALERLVAEHPGITVVRGRARELDLRPGRARVGWAGAEPLEAPAVVLAAGAWVSRIGGLPRPLPVEPVRGQMIAYAVAPLRHVIYGAGGYLVPRDDGRTLVGATMERVGFSVGVTSQAEAQLTRTALALAPGLRESPRLPAWSGLRPVTPDLLPIIGRDPDAPELIYACGHSRNGILLAPVTGEAVAAVAAGRAPAWDLSPFRVERFAVVEAAAPPKD